MTTLEKIAVDINLILNHDFRGKLAEASVLSGSEQYAAIADAVEESRIAILAIPEIKEGQELWEKRDRLVELEEDQSRGKYVPWFPRTGEYTCEEAFKMGQVAGELRDKEAGFRRVKVKG